MYEGADGVIHTTNTTNGFDRGVEGYFNSSKFKSLDKEDKELVCRVPLSQPAFLFMILCVWSLTVLAHMRVIVNTTMRIIAIKGVDHEGLRGVIQQRGGDIEVQGLTWWMKACIVAFVQLPRFFMTSVLLWLGSRWLIATIGFGDLLLNCVALEFILNLAHLLYTVLVPYSGKMLVQHTHLPHLATHEHETCANMFGMLACGLLAGMLSWIYMFHLQTVLPSYRWDVKAMCAEYLAHELAI
jgi:hypothetical protein